MYQYYQQLYLQSTSIHHQAYLQHQPYLQQSYKPTTFSQPFSNSSNHFQQPAIQSEAPCEIYPSQNKITSNLNEVLSEDEEETINKSKDNDTIDNLLNKNGIETTITEKTIKSNERVYFLIANNFILIRVNT